MNASIARRSRRFLLGIVLSLTTVAGSLGATLPNTESERLDRTELSRQKKDRRDATRRSTAASPMPGTLQLPWIANQGQADPNVAFQASTFAGTIFVTRVGEIFYVLPNRGGTSLSDGVVLREEFVGGHVARVDGDTRAATTVNYLTGSAPAKWATEVATYERVSLPAVYAGVDVKLRAFERTVEKLFYVRPRGRPEQIRMRVSGGTTLRVAPTGELQIETRRGTVRFSRPVAYQESTVIEPVAVRYVVHGNEYGFELGEYDKSRQVVIDPVLSGTLVGGSSDDRGGPLVVDHQGDLIIAGTTWSADFTGLTSASADHQLVGNEAFVAKFDASLTVLKSVTFLGGSGVDEAFGLALDSIGNIYVTGDTSSADFPGVGSRSADRVITDLGSGLRYDAFVAKLDPSLRSLLGATFLGGSAFESGRGIAVDDIGTVFVTGITLSDDFPGIGPLSADSTRLTSGQGETFVARVDSNLTSVLAATFLGGRGGSIAEALAIDIDGNIYIAGTADSADFAGVTPESNHSQGYGAFVARLDPDLGSVLGAIVLGGTGGTQALAIALDGTEYVYVSGVTDAADLPGITPASADHVHERTEAFLAKFDANLRDVLAVTFLGGSGGFEVGRALALDGQGGVYVAGTTGSSDFPGVNPRSADSTFAGPFEGFVAKLNADLSVIQGSTFIGGSDSDEGSGIALDESGHVYLSGTTFSSDLLGAGGGSRGGFIVRLEPNLSRETSLPACEQQIVNDVVDLVVTQTSGPTPHPGGFAGQFTIAARLTNLGNKSIVQPVTLNVVTLTNGNVLLSATEGGREVGSKQAISVGDDDVLSPAESVSIDINVGLDDLNPFQLYMDVEGCVASPQ